MSRKITRRVALASVIGALVAGPFVMRSLRKARSISNLPLSDYERKWLEFEAQTKVDIEECDGPSVVSFRNRPKEISSNFIMLDSSYDYAEFPLLASGIPSLCMVVSGNDRIEKDKAGVFFLHSDQIWLRISRHQSIAQRLYETEETVLVGHSTA